MRTQQLMIAGIVGDVNDKQFYTLRRGLLKLNLMELRALYRRVTGKPPPPKIRRRSKK